MYWGTLGHTWVPLRATINPPKTEPYKFIGLRAIGVTEPHKFIGSGGIPGPKPYKLNSCGYNSCGYNSCGCNLKLPEVRSDNLKLQPHELQPHPGPWGGPAQNSVETLRCMVFSPSPRPPPSPIGPLKNPIGPIGVVATSTVCRESQS